MNLPDGRVFIVAEGEDEQLDKFISAVREGPTHAVVKNVEVTEKQPTGEFSDFSIRF